MNPALVVSAAETVRRTSATGLAALANLVIARLPWRRIRPTPGGDGS